jgi:hypothetical protein
MKANDKEYEQGEKNLVLTRNPSLTHMEIRFHGANSLCNLRIAVGYK